MPRKEAASDPGWYKGCGYGPGGAGDVGHDTRRMDGGVKPCQSRFSSSYFCRFSPLNTTLLETSLEARSRSAVARIYILIFFFRFHFHVCIGREAICLVVARCLFTSLSDGASALSYVRSGAGRGGRQLQRRSLCGSFPVRCFSPLLHGQKKSLTWPVKRG